MKYLIVPFLFLTTTMFAQNTVTGKVIDAETLQPLSGANVYVEAKPLLGAPSGIEGDFLITGVENHDKLIVSFVGYYSQTILLNSIDVNNKILISLQPKIIPSQSVLVEASFGKEAVTPITFSKINRSEIEASYTVQDIPEFISTLPSTMFYSEGGNGVGYNYLSIRGFDQRRISVSINGIPQNEPEDHNVYWLDFPDLLASTELIQVQRGAGSGAFGYPAIGGSINIITSTFSNSPQIKLSASYGSYNTRKYSASFASGLIDNKYSVFAKIGQILSSGYRNSSWVKFNSYHLSAVRFDDNLTTQINLYGGPVADGLAYTGLPKFVVTDKKFRRENLSYWEADENGYTYKLQRRPVEIENFSQPHYELLNELKINKNMVFNSALFLVLGEGFFDYDASWADTSYFRLTHENGFNPFQNPGNALIRAMVENNQFGWIPRFSLNHGSGKLIFGGEVRFHKSTHWGSINYAENLPAGTEKEYRYYYYNGLKDIFSGFVQEAYNLNEKVNLLLEFQAAYHRYKIYNEKHLNNQFEVNGFYFNPRAGINYRFSDAQNLYLSFSRVTREPRLKNYYDAAESSGGELPQFMQRTDGTYNFDEPLVKPETMNDVELGTRFNGKTYSAELNLYYMFFENEIVKNGRLDRFGQPVTGNVDRTIHRGMEVSGEVKPINGIEIFANISYSNNIISSGKFYLDENDSIDLSGNRISGFPELLSNFGISYSYSGLFAKLTGKYVGEFFSDNYDNRLEQYKAAYPGFVVYTDNKNEAYFTADFFISYQTNLFEATGNSKIFLEANNIFNNLYSAYAIGGEFFPAAERNFLVGLQLGL